MRQVISISASSNVDAYVKMKEAYAGIRGYTLDSGGKKMPLLYGFDVPDLNAYWLAQTYKAFWARGGGGFFGAVGGLTSEAQNTLTRQEPILKAAANTTPYLIVPNYQGYWKATYQVASALDAMQMAPTSFQLAWESLKEATKEAPATIANAVKLTFGGNWFPDLGSLKWIMYGTLAVTAVYFLRKR